MFTKYYNGYKARAIAESLNERGFFRADAKPFTEKYVLYILHNSKYTGKVTRQGVEYDNIYPQIISNDLWQKVNTINEENKLAPSRKKEIYDYILSGKLVCGICKRKMCGESGTSHTKDIHYYYSCLSRRRKINCSTKSIQKQYLEDLVINTTAKLLNEDNNIHLIAENIYKLHKQEMNDNTNLKLLTKTRDEAIKASKNIVKAIEQGIITEMTKSRLSELEAEISRLEFEIEKEKQKSYTFLTIEEIETYLQSKVFSNTQDIKIRKLLVNTFIREIILYPDKLIITYNFTNPIENNTINPETIKEKEKQIDSALSSNIGSYIQLPVAPYDFFSQLRAQLENKKAAFAVFLLRLHTIFSNS